MAKNSTTRTPRPTKQSRPGVEDSRPSAGSCHYCRASLKPSDNYCSHCGMPADEASDKPLFVVEGLSNLFNIVFFESLLEQELNRASRYGHDLSVLVAEIDNLSELEASLGYDQANTMIRAVAEVMAGAIREPDTLAATNRVTALGTQRFMVLLPETGEEGAFRTAEKIRGLVGSTVLNIAGGELSVTVSIGVSGAGSTDVDANMVGRATQALIESHTLGLNRIQVAAER